MNGTKVYVYSWIKILNCFAKKVMIYWFYVSCEKKKCIVQREKKQQQFVIKNKINKHDEEINLMKNKWPERFFLVRLIFELVFSSYKLVANGLISYQMQIQDGGENEGDYGWVVIWKLERIEREELDYNLYLM
jgi:hypothetical protein